MHDIMKSKYECPKLKNVITIEEELLVEGSEINMGGIGMPDAKNRGRFDFGFDEDEDDEELLWDI